MNDGSVVAAFFDVDRTLLSVNSGEIWVRHLWRTGRLPLSEAARMLRWILQYRLGFLDFEAVTARAVQDYAGRDYAEVAAEVKAWFDAELATTITEGGRARIEEHRRQGHRVALLTTGTRFVAEPLALLLAIPPEDILCTEFEVEAGHLTGRHLPPACGGPGKVARAEGYAERWSLSLERSFFYTDSYSDVPMLSRVGHPRVINPDRRLRRYARKCEWEIEIW